MDAKRYARFVELSDKDYCTELEIEEWAQIGWDIAREDVPELLDEVERLTKQNIAMKEFCSPLIDTWGNVIDGVDDD